MNSTHYMVQYEGNAGAFPTVHDGRQCEHFIACNSVAARQRYEIVEQIEPSVLRQARAMLYSFAVNVPAQNTDHNRIGIAQWHAHPGEGSEGNFGVPLQLNYRDGRLLLVQTGTDGKQIYAYDEEAPEAWMNFTFYIKWAQDKTGFIRTFIGGDLVYQYDGQTAFQHDPPFCKLGVHSWANEDHEIAASGNNGLPFHFYMQRNPIILIDK